jgi:hypothetical protein
MSTTFNLPEEASSATKLIVEAMKNWDVLLSLALKNYHVPGFNSIILKRTPALTLRLYVCKPGESSLSESLSPDNNTLWIHNHRFFFRCQTLAGWMKNLVYSESETTTDQGQWFKYKYKSALASADERMHLAALGRVNLALEQVEDVPAGFCYQMLPEQLHRILVPNDELVIMLFWEHEKVEIVQQLYSKRELPASPETTSSNQKFKPDELRELLDLVLERLKQEQ